MDEIEDAKSNFFECEDSMDCHMVNKCLEIEDVEFIADTSQRFWELCTFGGNDSKNENR